MNPQTLMKFSRMLRLRTLLTVASSSPSSTSSSPPQPRHGKSSFIHTIQSQLNRLSTTSYRRWLVLVSALFLVSLTINRTNTSVRQRQQYTQIARDITDTISARLMHATSSYSQNADVNFIEFSLVSVDDDDENDDDDDDDDCFMIPSCMNALGQQLARAFPKHPYPAWCVPSPWRNDSLSLRRRRGPYDDNSTQELWQGQILVKVPKAASSTMAGVALRIANRTQCGAVQCLHVEGYHYRHRYRRASPQQQHHHHQQQQHPHDDDHPSITATTTTTTTAAAAATTTTTTAAAAAAATTTTAKHLHETTSFLWTSLREPSLRAFSMAIFLELVPQNISLTDDNVIRTVHSHSSRNAQGTGGFMMRYTSLTRIPYDSLWNRHEPERIQNKSVVHALIQEIIQGYDFIVLVERMDESLVVLALLMGIELGDVLVASAKVAGFYVYKVNETDVSHSTCVHVQKGIISPNVSDYFRSKSWRAMNYGDYLLYAAANASLDRTIYETIGLPVFQKALHQFLYLKSLALSACGKELAENGCTAHGTPVNATECYARDFGCGYRCIDRMLISQQQQ
jgi:hypothetical protein